MCMPKYLDSDGVAYLWGKIKHNLNNKMTYYSRTKSDWDSDRALISEKDVLYIYSDYKVIQKDGQEIYLPGLKIGDGLSYLIDLPFINAQNEAEIQRLQNLILDHMNNKIAHIQSGEREFWNNKLNYQLKSQEENLVFNRL